LGFCRVECMWFSCVVFFYFLDVFCWLCLFFLVLFGVGVFLVCVPFVVCVGLVWFVSVGCRCFWFVGVVVFLMGVWFVV